MTKEIEDRSRAAVVDILRTADLLRRRYAAVLGPHDLTLQQYNVLQVLRAAKGRAVPTLDIGAGLIEHAPGITRLLDRLEAKGLVKRERSADDRRLVLCRIAPAGRELLAHVEGPVDAVDRLAVEGFDPDDLDALLEMLEAIRLSNGSPVID